MIYEVSGDILLSKAQAVAHGIAPNDAFDKGLARALREKWPMMHKDYRHYAHQTHPKAGEIWEWGGFGVRIFNLLTHDGSFDHEAKLERATLANVNHCLRRLRHALEKDAVAGIAIPRLATGTGGLDWEEVKPLIQTHLGELQTPVYLYSEYHAGVEANEPGLK